MKSMISPFRALTRFAAVASLALCIVLPASASVVLSIVRIDDTNAIVTGTGTLGTTQPSGNLPILVIDDPFSVKPTITQKIIGTSTMTVGSRTVQFAYQSDPGNPDPDLFGNGDPTIYFGSLTGGFSSGDAISGQFSVHLVGGATFSPIGTSGNVNWGAFDGTPAGTWNMVSATTVPEPGSLALFGLAALAAAGVAKRRQK